MTDASANSDWSPDAAPLVADDLTTCPVVIVHYWASWNRHDREVNQRLASIRETYGSRIAFRSCDIDRAENHQFTTNIVNIPAINCFVGGKLAKTVIGLRSIEKLREICDEVLASAEQINVIENHAKPILNYAGAGAIRRKRLPAIIFPLAAFALTFVGLHITPQYYGSGATRANPAAVVPAIGVWLLMLAYIAGRIRSESTSPGSAARITGAWIAATAMPIQVWIWREDAGFPQSRCRPDLMLPLWIALGGLLMYMLASLTAPSNN